MSQEPHNQLVLVLRLYRFLLRAYPPAFRQEYGLEMFQVFQTSCRARLQRRGWRGLFVYCLYTFVDLLLTAGQEWWRAWTPQSVLERSRIMVRPVDEFRPFMEAMTAALERQPTYYPIFVTKIEALQSVNTVAACLALEGDLSDPTTLFTLFQHAGDGTPSVSTPRWLARLCEAVRQSQADLAPAPAAEVTGQLVRRIYADPDLFELIAADEVGQQLVDVVESLALDGNVEEIDQMLALMQQLGDNRFCTIEGAMQ